ncbi:MAG: PadR family transcriptional regulator [Anaerolineales bacterium]|nr:PadR family transcriptional regulator [Anaerolineales bacterium]
MSTTRLVLLGLLRRQPLHGYELKHIIEEHMGDWTSIAFGSIYFALGKLEEEGMLDKVATEKQGNRPSRSVYQLTETGRDEFLRLLRETWRTTERQYYDLDVAIAFMEALPVDEVIGYLRGRITGLEQTLVHMEAHEKEQMSRNEVPAAAQMVFEHSRLHMQAELTWLQDLLGKVKQGSIP